MTANPRPMICIKYCRRVGVGIWQHGLPISCSAAPYRLQHPRRARCLPPLLHAGVQLALPSPHMLPCFPMLRSPASAGTLQSADQRGRRACFGSCNGPARTWGLHRMMPCGSNQRGTHAYMHWLNRWLHTSGKPAVASTEQQVRRRQRGREPEFTSGAHGTGRSLGTAQTGRCRRGACRWRGDNRQDEGQQGLHQPALGEQHVACKQRRSGAGETGSGHEGQWSGSSPDKPEYIDAKAVDDSVIHKEA